MSERSSEAVRRKPLIDSADSFSLMIKRVTQHRAQPTRATGLSAFLDAI